MRWLLTGFGLLVGGAAWGDDLRTADAVPRAPLPAEDVAVYIRQLEHVAGIVESNYVRPVLRSDLLGAAIKGLHGATRTAIPGSLEQELQQARSEEVAGFLLSSLSGAGNPFAVDSGADLRRNAAARMHDLTRQARERLGDVAELRGQGALFISLRAMIAALDPYCGLVTPEEAQRTDAAEDGNGYGIVVLDHHGTGPLVVRTVVPGSPAQQAGLRPGDRITRINGKPVHGDATAGAPLHPMRATLPLGLEIPAPGEAAPVPLGPLSLQYERAGASKVRTARLEPAIFHGETVLGVQRHDDNTWDYWLDHEHRVAYVRIAALNHSTPGDLLAALSQLTKPKLGGLILDLRWCPGGYLDSSIAVAQVFVGAANVATVKHRDGYWQQYAGAADAKVGDFPLLLLVNGETSGGAELIAAAVQDNRRGMIAGQRTLGKASIQKQFPLPNDTLLKLTTGTFVRPSGKNLHRFPNLKPIEDWGIRPDPGLEFRVSADVNRQVREWHLLQSLRPGKSREILPLDDPVNDPQRQAALVSLVKGIDKDQAFRAAEK